MKQVIISGLPRSGTSWVGKSLSFATDFTYYREPDNSEFVSDVPGRILWDLYLKAGDVHLCYEEFLVRALEGKIATSFTMRENPGPLLRRIPQLSRYAERFPLLYMRKRNVLIKFVRRNLSLDWISGLYPTARIVSLIRHPVGQGESWLKQGWTPNPTVFLEDSRLVEEHLADYVDLIKRADTFWAKCGVQWGMINRIVYNQAIAGAAHSVVPFEWLCADSGTRMRELSARSDMQWTPQADKFVRPTPGITDSDPYSLVRDSRVEIDKWRASVSDADISECRTFAEPFGLPFYENFDPRVAEPVWGTSALPASTVG